MPSFPLDLPSQSIHLLLAQTRCESTNRYFVMPALSSLRLISDYSGSNVPANFHAQQSAGNQDGEGIVGRTTKIQGKPLPSLRAALYGSVQWEESVGLA